MIKAFFKQLFGIKSNKIPDNLGDLIDELSRGMRMVENASEPAHLTAAINWFNLVSNKWALVRSNEDYNLIIVGMFDKIAKKREELNFSIYTES